ncbi:phosphoadenosine phosphosulfate reductase family protein [Brevifollis gellanilyticus]|uniref:Phosphoadenosine phosphosulfate reductase n=1 Tax=Brevifollis gellanilyticus TaxID=748831 RepID=A0A512MCI4_9BACT|nr:phosphoadenosine phosphosulfate reductase family protein [Brevifollis gellanilyticus]GEP44454.1 phosphoadenosine phosphosulfate reductase [Brevifollis gellanilyticus]
MKPPDQNFGSDASARHVLNVSGGKDSSAMALLMAGRVRGQEHFKRDDMEYLFCDTQKELPETYEYLARLEAELGSKITYLNAKAGFDHWHKVFGGYLPSPQNRWCTKMLKLKPFEAHVGEEPVVSYVGLRADEDRVGYISTKPNIKTRYPLREAGIDYKGVIQILEDSGLGLPTFMKWGRTNSGCTFCFFQTPYEWIRLHETYPDRFEEAMKYETIDPSDPNKQFTWMSEGPLTDLLNPVRRDEILLSGIRSKVRTIDKSLVSVFSGESTSSVEACLLCQK